MKTLCTAWREIFHVIQDPPYDMGLKSQNKSPYKDRTGYWTRFTLMSFRATAKNNLKIPIQIIVIN